MDRGSLNFPLPGPVVPGVLTISASLSSLVHVYIRLFSNNNNKLIKLYNTKCTTLKNYEWQCTIIIIVQL